VNTSRNSTCNFRVICILTQRLHRKGLNCYACLAWQIVAVGIHTPKCNCLAPAWRPSGMPHTHCFMMLDQISSIISMLIRPLVWCPRSSVCHFSGHTADKSQFASRLCVVVLQLLPWAWRRKVLRLSFPHGTRPRILSNGYGLTRKDDTFGKILLGLEVMCRN
jgi:hypothetical protein